MKWSFFKSGKKEAPQGINRPEKQLDGNAESVFMGTIDEKRNEDPLVGAKIGAKEVLNSLISMMKDSKGVHIESLICVLGALAGYSCQASLRRELIEIRGLSENQVFAVIETKNGNKYYFGDLINKPLAENPLSVWALAGGAMKRLGIDELIDLGDIFGYVSQTVGNDSYGIPRIPEEHKPGDIPFNYVKHLWPVFLKTAEKYCAAPAEWPIMFGLAVQEAIVLGRDVLNPLLSLSIAMESAIPMAKADINREK